MLLGDVMNFLKFGKLVLRNLAIMVGVLLLTLTAIAALGALGVSGLWLLPAAVLGYAIHDYYTET
jgi:ABC-type transport system involved in cytochrome bd biosynthesis fused ATPase/permease subunit